MYFYTGIVFFLMCMGNLKRNKMIYFIKLISVTQEKKVDLVSVWKVN